MRAWTVHLPPESRPAGSNATPAVIPERFSWAAALFGLLWLLTNRVWWAAGALVGIGLLIGALLPPGAAIAAAAAIQLLLGFHAHDLRRAALAMRGWTQAGVVLAPTEDAAIARLLHVRPELIGPWAKAVLA